MVNSIKQGDMKQSEPCILVIFGATGDLTARKLMPALYNLAREGQLPQSFACVGFGRREKTDEVFRKEMQEKVSSFSRVKPIDQPLWQKFENTLFYHAAEFHDDAGYDRLKARLEELDKKLGTKGNRVFYLSTQPSQFPLIIEKLKKQGLIYPEQDPSGRFSRVIIEKPFGHDYSSAIELQKKILESLAESQIYRIDHYLGKETVQNILVFRFSNSIFEAVWNNKFIDHVQITVGEDIGVGTRGKFWEEAGMLRDIVQNHMMQLLSILTMEPPGNLSASAIHDEKVKVLESIHPIVGEDINRYTVRGQYAPGLVGTEKVKGYREEDNVDPNSAVETFVALQLFIDNWRWSGVPFFLRAGKRMPKRTTEIAVVFKQPPRIQSNKGQTHSEPNVLAIRIQPNEGIDLKINSKIPGLANLNIQPVKMDFRYDSYFGLTPPDAYERLIADCILGDTTLFARDDEVFASWKLLSPILENWQANKPKDFPNYPAGTWGPQASEELLLKEGLRKWYEL